MIKIIFKMKNKTTLLIALAAGLFTSTAQAQAKITVKMLNKPSDTIYVKGRGFNKMIVADKKGHFHGSFDVTEGFYKLDAGEQYADLYLTNTSNLEVSLDYSKFDETLDFKGNGSNENNYLAKKNLEEQQLNLDALMASKDEAELKVEMDKVRNDIYSKFPTNLSTNFIAKLKEDTEKNLKSLEGYMKESFAVRKLNGSVSPSFAYENTAGKIIKLEDFKGKYVYVDVWATWCGPCRAEIPHLKKTEEAYHGKNIEFVSISVDVMKDKEKWKKFVTEKELGGVQILADKDWKSDFVTGYKINGIPRFILIGPDGKIVNADAPRPSSPELTKLLDSVVK